MTREEKLQKAHQMFDNRELLIELKWQREYLKRGYIINQEELFNLWIFDECIKTLEKEPRWIPVKWHEITDEERKQNEYPKEWAVYLDCVMPDDGQEILTTTKSGYIEFDTCFHDGCGYSLDSARDWIDDITAWMPLPKPYKADRRKEE